MASTKLAIAIHNYSPLDAISAALNGGERAPLTSEKRDGWEWWESATSLQQTRFLGELNRYVAKRARQAALVVA